MILFSNITSMDQSSKLFFTIALIISLFSFSGNVNSQTNFSKVPQTEWVIAEKRRRKKTISLAKARLLFTRKHYYYPSFLYQSFVLIYNQLVEIIIRNFTHPFLPIIQKLFLLPIKIGSQKTDEEPFIPGLRG